MDNPFDIFQKEKDGNLAENSWKNVLIFCKITEKPDDYQQRGAQEPTKE